MATITAAMMVAGLDRSSKGSPGLLGEATIAFVAL